VLDALPNDARRDDLCNWLMQNGLTIPSLTRSVLRFSKIETEAFELPAARLQRSVTIGLDSTVSDAKAP
jgi:hypothetical protein